MDLRNEELSDADVARLLRSSMPWRDWIRNDLLRYFYAIVVFAFDIFLVLELARKNAVDDALGLILLGVTFILSLVLEFLLYRGIWPHGIMTGTEEKVGKR